MADQRPAENTADGEKTERRWRRAAVVGTWADAAARLLQLVVRDRW